MSSLNWAVEFERIDPSDRSTYSGGFEVTRSRAFQHVLDELGRWDGVTDVHLDSGTEHQKQNPNKLYTRASFDDPGVIVRSTR